MKNRKSQSVISDVFWYIVFAFAMVIFYFIYALGAKNIQVENEVTTQYQVLLAEKVLEGYLDTEVLPEFEGYDGQGLKGQYLLKGLNFAVHPSAKYAFMHLTWPKDFKEPETRLTDYNTNLMSDGEIKDIERTLAYLALEKNFHVGVILVQSIDRDCKAFLTEVWNYGNWKKKTDAILLITTSDYQGVAFTCMAVDKKHELVMDDTVLVDTVANMLQYFKRNEIHDGIYYTLKEMNRKVNGELTIGSLPKTIRDYLMERAGNTDYDDIIKDATLNYFQTAYGEEWCIELNGEIYDSLNKLTTYSKTIGLRSNIAGVFSGPFVFCPRGSYSYDFEPKIDGNNRKWGNYYSLFEEKYFKNYLVKYKTPTKVDQVIGLKGVELPKKINEQKYNTGKRPIQIIRKLPVMPTGFVNLKLTIGVKFDTYQE